MTHDIDQALRDALADLADEGKPVNLAGPAIRLGERRRLRNRIGITAAGFAAVAALTAATLPWHGSGASTLPVATTSTPAATKGPTQLPSMRTGPIRLTDGWLLGGGSSTSGTWYLDRVKAQYRQSSYYTVPAPVGNLVAVNDRERARMGVLDTGNGGGNHVQWLGEKDDGSMVPEWSSDGTALLYPGTQHTVIARESGLTFTKGPACTRAPRWLPGDIEVACPTAGGLQVFSATTGAPTRTLQLSLPAGAELGPAHTWSPDGGRLVIVGSNDRGEQVPVIWDIATGATVPLTSAAGNDARTAYWVDDNQVLVIGHFEIVLFRSDGTVAATWRWPAEFADDELPNFTLVRG